MMTRAMDILGCVIGDIAEEEQWDADAVTITKLDTAGANYMSIAYTAIVTSPTRPDLHIFAKIATLHPEFRRHMHADISFSFLNEIIFYTSTVPALEALQDKYKIAGDDRYAFPVYYGSRSTANEETIVMEDLISKGYATLNRRAPVDWVFASHAVEELAKFHALTLAYKHDYPEEFDANFHLDEFRSVLELRFQKTKSYLALQAARGELNVEEEMVDRVTSFIDDKLGQREEFMKFYKASKFGFLIHGDYRPSNIMYKREGDKILDILPLDYQGLHRGSPSIDLIYFIYCCTDEEFRRLHYENLINHYYNSFVKFLTKLELEAEQVFSRKDFDEDFNENRHYGLCVAMTVLPTILADVPPDVENEGIVAFDTMEYSHAYKERYLPIIQDFVRWGIL